MIALQETRPTTLVTVATLLGAILGAAPLHAQKSDAEIGAEIAFARGLASDWSFVDLAEDVIREVEDGGVTGKMGERLGLVKCDVYAIGARNEKEPARRNELFESALGAYKEFIDRNPYSDEKSSAEAAYVATSSTYARALELNLEEAVGEEAETLKGRQVDVLTDAVKLTADLIEALKAKRDERTEAESRELYDLMLNRGNMLASIGRADPTNTFFFDEAIKALEELVFLVGEGTPYALRAYVAIGRVYQFQNLHEDAAAYYEAVIEQTIPMGEDTDGNNKWLEIRNKGNGGEPISEREKGLRFLFLELSMDGLMTSYEAQGSTEDAARHALHYYNIQRQEGLHFSAQGYLSLLSCARALLNSSGYVGGNLTLGEGEWFVDEDEMKAKHRARRSQIDTTSLALQIAQQVNDENKGNTLQVRAQKVISEISTRPGVTVSPEILFQAAQGEYFDGNYNEALAGLHRVQRSLDSSDQAERLEFGARVMNFIGNTYRKMERPLEAAMAFREGATTWEGEPEYDPKNAQGYYSMVNQFAKTATLEKEIVEAMVTEAEDLVAKIGTQSKDKVLYDQGEKLRRKGDFAGAVGKYEQIAEGEDFWEKGLVQIAVCKFRLEKDAKQPHDESFRLLDDYIEKVRTDAKYATVSPSKLSKRKEASAAAEFYRGLILFGRGEHQQVADKVSSFYDDYPEQDRLVNWCLDMVMRSHLQLGNLDEARTALIRMVGDFGDKPRTANASKAFYNFLDTKRDASKDDGERATLLAEMAQHLERGNQSSATFGNLRKESQHWMELKDYAKAEGVLSKMAQRHGDEAEQADAMRRYVYPDLGQALLELGRVADAKTILHPLATNDEKRASKRVLILWARSIAGWLEGSGNDIKEVVGAGGSDEEFQAVISKLDAISKSGDKWVSCEWYEHKFMIAYTYYAWSKQDSRKLDSAQKQLAVIESEMEEPNFAQIDGFCMGEETEPALRGRLGEGVLQSWYRWLSRTLK
ncbi:MAG: tetratricopeptide repeat protein [bacterium]|nr:tetratricopeptide repeat protein [bacterium]